MEQLTLQKKQLREQARQIRNTMSEATRQEKSNAMAENILKNPLFANCQQLFCFLSLPKEPDTSPLLQAAAKLGKTIAVPICLPERQMCFRTLPKDSTTWDAVLCSGAFGVREPVDSLTTLIPDAEKNPICIVPGLAFDYKGGRLGYGAGYYDRWLKKYPFVLRLGYGMEDFLVESVPMEQTDCQLDGIITDRTMEVWNGKERL